MGKVIAQLAMSLDGFIADKDDGCDDLFGFYENGRRRGEPERGLARAPRVADDRGPARPRRSAGSARPSWAGGSTTSRTAGTATPGGEVPMVVLTHEAPDDWPRGGVPIHFVSGVEAAVAKAQELAGDKDVAIAGGDGDPGGARRRAARRDRGQPGAGDPGRRDPVVRRLARSGDALGPRGASQDQGVTHLRYRGAEVADSVPRDRPVPVRRLDRLADRRRPPPTRTCAASGWAARPRRAGTTSGRTSTSTCCARPARRRRSTSAGWRGPGPTSTSATSGRCREHVAGRPAVLPQPAGPARAAARADPHHRPARLRPVRPPLAPRRTPARDADRAARPGRADRPRGRGRRRRRWRRRSTRCGSAGSTGEWLVNRAIARGHVAEAVDFYLRFALARWCGCSGSSTARGATTSGCATCARTCRPTWPTRSRSWCPGATSARSRSCRCDASRGWTSCWRADGSAPVRVSARTAARCTRGAGRGAGAPRTRRPRSRAGTAGSARSRRARSARPAPPGAGPEPRGETAGAPRSSSGRLGRLGGAAATAAYGLGRSRKIGASSPRVFAPQTCSSRSACSSAVSRPWAKCSPRSAAAAPARRR